MIARTALTGGSFYPSISIIQPKKYFSIKIPYCLLLYTFISLFLYKVIFMNQAEIIGAVIARVRKEKGLSQEVLSSFANIARTHLTMIENGQRQPALDTFLKLSSALNMKPSELMKQIETALDPLQAQ